MEPQFSFPTDLSSVLDVLRSTDNTFDDVLDIDGLADLLDFADPQGIVGEAEGLNPVDEHLPRHSTGVSSETSSGFQVSAEGSPLPMDLLFSSNPTSRVEEQSGFRKRRTRNASQMEHNKVAQQKYRERKKLENMELQNAVNMLTAQVAALKAIEVQSKEAEARNASLSSMIESQKQEILGLNTKVLSQASTISTQTAKLDEQALMLKTQQNMIMDQHQRLAVQEEIIASMKYRLKACMEAAWDQAELEAQDPSVLCRKMQEAVRQALQGADDIEGLQELLAKMPDDVVVRLCKSIMAACRDLFPELQSRYTAMCLHSCHAVA
ncbi:hypothetical protein CEUSTIGMA_g7985.t1 [Chlamydomonas eustigma]|uniref:BZIP domain-containing protein n=1 Tax=Chlamydomonas eustigma TaxID=1157962 RepID=A0A250XBT3_9CHLO|nr:hypothetical protein CEUSTIGMA_g7985.t1 [Chlamydomonas eustigma]|eukprot:GAX80547.1 hypothetical protein CEUSTIGMA_g7985.t1 [Chlamydomonas eustigma]